MNQTPFSGMRPPAAPAGLGERVLAAAAAARNGAREPLAVRLMASRPLRLAWSLVVIALLAVNLGLAARDAGDRTQVIGPAVEVVSIDGLSVVYGGRRTGPPAGSRLDELEEMIGLAADEGGRG